jgi:ATP-dependent Clp protease ATP-binding subunit ClpA
MLMDRLISPGLLSKLTTLSAELEANILGQPEVLSDICALLRRSFCGLRFPGRPLASMLFMGPTGVGKTETARLFTRHLLEEESKLVRLDMSEYMTMQSIDLLRGSRQGERGLLGYYYDRSEGRGTLLFDEIEKAHPLIMDLFLQILSAARFTLASGETLDLRNFVVVATTNIGSRMLMESRSQDRETLVRRTLAAARSEMRPETFARFDLHCVFNKLDYATLRRVAELHVRKVLEIINSQGHCIRCAREVVEHVRREGYSEHFGARPMEAAAMRVLGQVVAERMLSGCARPVRGEIGFDPTINKTLFATLDA